MEIFRHQRESKRSIADADMPRMQKGSLVSLERRSEAGNRKRKARMQLGEQVLTQFFEDIAESCQERKVRHSQCMQLSAHETLCSLLMANDIQPTLPLQEIYRLSAKVGNDEHGIQLFRKQWEEYIRYLYAANVNEVQKQSQIDKNWFDKQTAKITFRTAFTTDIWLRTSQDEDRFDLFATGSVLGCKRKPEDLLSSADILDRDAPRDAKAVIMTHLENRKVRARAKILCRVFNKWLAKWKAHITSLPENLAMDHPKVIFQPLTARSALDELVANKQEKWAELYAKEGDRVSAHAADWEKDADRLFEQKKAASDAAQDSLRQKMTEHIRLAAYRHWVTRILDAVKECKQRLSQCREEDQVFQHICSNWPTPCQEQQQPSKRLKIFRAFKPESKLPAGKANLTEQVQAVLSAEFSGIESETDDELKAFADALGKLESVLEAHQTLKDTVEPLEDRKLAYENAVFMDYARFTKMIAERLGNQAQVIVQNNMQHDYKHIAELEKFEQDLVTTTLEAKEGVRTAYAATYELIYKCISKQVWERLQKRAERLTEFDEKQRGTVALYEPWLDRTVLTPEQKEHLHELFPDLTEVPMTISAALIQSSAWFEQLYESECGE